MSKDKPAISIIDEAANIYWEKIKDLPVVVKRLSIHDIRQIFSVAVTPAIDEVRRLDRQTHIASLESPWVSVEDRVPSDTRNVIVYFPDDDLVTVGYYCQRKAEFGYTECWRLTQTSFFWAVTHWMPLPEPPE